MSPFKELWKDGRFKFGFMVVLLLALLWILSAFSPYGPQEQLVVPRDRPPSIEHPLGTTSQGRDVFWTLSFAVKNSLTIALIASILSRIIAVGIALVAGFKGGITDRVLMSLNDSFIVLPYLPLLMLIGVMFRGGLGIVGWGLVLAFFGWAWDVRVIRSDVLSLRERAFTHTAILSGMKVFELLRKEYLPHIIPLVFATAINNMFWAVAMEITLAVLGLTNPAIPTLGTMIYWAVNYQSMFFGYWWWILTPVCLAVLLFVALYLLSVSISEYLDPRTRMQRIGAGGGGEVDTA